MITTETEWLSCADTAKLVRGALKRAFPTVKFSVRSDNYAGGASIDIRWIDGPRTKAVERVAEQYSGAGFDGMIDLKHYRSHFLRPDGSVYLMHEQGTEGSRGSVPAEDNRALARVMPPDVRAVRFGADFIFCSRKITDEERLTLWAQTMIQQRCKCEDTGHGLRFGNDYVDNLARSVVWDVDFLTEGESLDPAFRRVVLRETA